jgi:hypothetical protein
VAFGADLWCRDVAGTVEALRGRHGDVKACRIAHQCRQLARRARSRRRFEFWAAVTAELESGLIGGKSVGAMDDIETTVDSTP